MKKIIAGIASFFPLVALAQTITDANSLGSKLTSLGNWLIGLLIAFAVIWIIINAVRFIMKADSPEDRKTIQASILWGIVGLFVILSIWGLVRILTNTFRTDTTAPTDQYPTIQYPPRVTN